MQKYKSRQEVPKKYKWDLTELFKNDNEYDKAFNKLKKDIDKLSTYQGCTKNSSKLYEFLDKDAKTIALLYRVIIYAYVINDQELGISSNMDRLAKAEELETKYANAIAFFAEELLKLNKDEYNNLFKNNKLKEFKYQLDDIYRAKEHVLPKDKEIIINEMHNAAMNYETLSQTMLNSLNDYGTIKIDGEEEKILQTNLSRLLKNDSKEIRKEARNKYYKVLDQYGVMSAALLNSYVKTSITNAKLHNYKDAWDAKIFNTKIPNDAYKALVLTVEDNVIVLQKYYKIFKDTLKLKTLDSCDLNLEMIKTNREYSIEEGQQLCLDALKPLGNDYCNHFKKIFDNHYIDYACYPGKCSGAYSISGYDFNSRILMSWNYDLRSISTTIHEGGHHVHHQYLVENNPVQYREAANIVAEVASLTNECLLSSYLAINGKDKTEKLKGIENILDVFISNLFGAVREGKIEQDFYDYVNKSNMITKDYMNTIVNKSYEKYQGNIVNRDDYSNLSWISRSHYYMNYYLYNYAICISVASYVANEILNGNKGMLNKYIKFLSTGSNHDNYDIFKILGVDIADKNLYIKAIKYFDSMLDKFALISKEGEKNG